MDEKRKDRPEHEAAQSKGQSANEVRLADSRPRIIESSEPPRCCAKRSEGGGSHQQVQAKAQLASREGTVNRLSEIFRGDEQEPTKHLEPVRLSEDPSMLLLFTDEVDTAELHFVDDETVFAYVPCPKTGCPVCFLGMMPRTFHLLPVLNVVKRAVEVLRVSARRGPGTLASGLLPHLTGHGTENKLLLVTRHTSKFYVEVASLSDDADRCTKVIQSFLTARESDLSLLTAFPQFSATDLADVPSIRRALNAVGGWDETQNPGQDHA